MLNRYIYPSLNLNLFSVKTLLFALFLSFSLTGWTQEPVVSTQLSSLQYRNAGPSRGGRVTTVAGVVSRANEFYMGACGGGVWKSTDWGIRWRNVSDGFFATGSIGAIRVAPGNPDVVYVGTGSDGIRSNIIIGKGMYRSDDAGETWKFIGLEKTGQIGAVEVHPDDADICFVAAIGNPFGPGEERGVFKTVDGGETWQKVLFISDDTGACDLEICPGNPDIIYASVWTVRRKPWTIISGSAEGGVYRSLDGGDTWSKLVEGLPKGIIGKGDLAVCATKPENLYVLMEASDEQGGLYFSDNYGERFVRISDRSSLLDRPFYYTNLDVDPTNPDILFVNTTGSYKSTDRGKSWQRFSTPHGDNHDLWINPAHPEIMIQSNDGGANVTRDGGANWSTQDNQPTAELYQVNIDDQFPYWLYAGQQDNSTLAIPATSGVGSRRGESSMIPVGGCETGPAVPKPGNPNIVYANCKGMFGVFNKITGQEKKYYVGAQSLYGHNPKDLIYRFQRVSPIFVSPHNPDVVYHGSQYLHKTTDDGVTWETISPDLTANEPDKQVISGSPITRDITGEEYYSTLYAVVESPLIEGVLWVGANDGPIHVSRDGGKTWANVTPPDLPPGGRVQTLEASPHRRGKAYCAVYRYMLDDWEPYIYRTSDYGHTWIRLTPGNNGIPNDFPTRVVREDPDREGLLYAGTEFGMFISLNDGQTWQSFQQNLPVVPVTDIKVYRNDLILSTMGRSFWIMDDISPLHQLGDRMVPESNFLFHPRAAYRSPDTDGAHIDYFLARETAEVTLEVTRPTGEKVRTLRAGKEAGFQRITWDLRTDGQVMGFSRRGSSGRRVVPSTYLIELSVDGEKHVTELEVLPDPRMVADGMTGADYQEQFDLSVSIQNLQSQSISLTSRIDSVWSPLNKRLGEGEKGSRKEKNLYQALSTLRSELVTDTGPYPQPMLNDQIGYLYSMISRTDQKPGRDAYNRLKELTLTYEELLKKTASLIE